MTSTAPVSAIVTAYRRTEQTLATLERIAACRPSPSEILVHVDGGQVACADAIRHTFPNISVLMSDANVGPGGGRNRLIARSANELVASFDDDSYPLDLDYFARVEALFRRFPDTSLITASVTHCDEKVAPPRSECFWVSDFSGGACAYRRAVFSTTDGYVPLRLAYGMEEVDLALRLHAKGLKILFAPTLRVFHDTDRRRHAAPEVTAASISNIALLTYLRYPRSLWPVGVVQCMNRIVWLVGNRRWRGILAGIAMIPRHIHRHRHYRERVPSSVLRSYLLLRRAPVPAGTLAES